MGGVTTDARAAAHALAVLAMVGGPLPLALWLVPGSADHEDTALAHELLIYPSVVVAGTLFYVAWRLAPDAVGGWLAATVTFVGAQGLGLAAVRLARPGAVEASQEWLSLVDIAVQVALSVAVVLAARRALPFDPFATGLLAGIGVTAARAGILHLGPPPETATLAWVLSILLFVAAMVTAALLLRLRRSPAWVRARVATAIVLLAVSHLILPPARITVDGGDLLAIALTVAGGVLLATTGFDVLHHAVARQRGTVRGLHEQIEHLEAGVRVDRARLHEINATLAGLAHASRLLHGGLLPAQARRAELEQMIDLEMARLQRLMTDRDHGGPEDVALDEVLRPLVVAHRTRGRVVQWSPGGPRVRCRSDDLAAVVNILLENAAQHAGTAVALETTEVDGRVELRVSDRGPGIDPATRHHLFQWGGRGASSHGQGIGLNVAQRLMADQDGALGIEQSGPGGTTFLVVVPAAEDEQEDDSHLLPELPELADDRVCP